MGPDTKLSSTKSKSVEKVLTRKYESEKGLAPQMYVNNEAPAKPSHTYGYIVIHELPLLFRVKTSKSIDHSVCFVYTSRLYPQFYESKPPKV